MNKLVFFTWTIVGLFLLVGWPALADTIKLKTGAQIDGTIQSESDTEVQIETANASGTIFQTQTIKKSDIAEIIRPTPEQRAAAEMEAAYKQTLKYQLDPQFSQPLSYYNQVLVDVFQKFLTKYPKSPYEKELTDRMAQWTEERDKVNSGMGRIGTEWLPAEEVAKRMQDSRAQAMLEKGRELASQGEFAAALDQFRAILTVTHRAALVDDARKSYAEVGKMWSDSLERTKETVSGQIKLTEDDVSRLRQEDTKAEADLHDADQLPTDPSNRRLGQDASASRYRLQASITHDAYEKAKANLVDLRKQLLELENHISAVKTMISTAGALIATGETPPPRVAQVVTAAPPVVVPHPEPASDTPDVLVTMANFFKAYWIYGLVGFVLIAWAGTRVFTK